MLGRQILAARDLIGMSQEELASAAGVSAATLTSWERGQRVPRRETIRLVVEALERRGIEFLNHGSPGVRLRPEKASIPV